MAALIAAVGPVRLGEHALRTQHSPFEALSRAIAHQQLNGVAANRILGRFIALYAPASFPTPAQLLETADEPLRAAGFSRAKIAALRDLATKTLEGVVPAAEQLATLSDVQIIERLTAVRGIGRWTVEMMLIFQLERPDVLPVGDFGVRNGFRLAYGLAGMPLPRALAAYGERWKPYRSIAAWYLWRAVELSRAERLPACARPPRIAISKLARKVAPVRRRLKQQAPRAGRVTARNTRKTRSARGTRSTRTARASTARIGRTARATRATRTARATSRRRSGVRPQRRRP